MQRRITCVLLWVMGLPLSAQVSADADGLLERIRQQAQANLLRMPDYLCLETVERERRPRPEVAFEPVDTIRLQVAVAGEKELFAWPDSARLEQDDITQLVRHGAIGTGSFALLAQNVFVSGGADFRFLGEEILRGRPAYRYDYAMPIERSGYRLRVQTYETRVPFHGAFWVDAENLDLMRLQVEVDEIPPSLDLLRSSKVMDYQRVPIGAGEFLLPAFAELNMLGARGDASRNRIRFGGCRQFVSESTISFDDFTEGSRPASAEQKRGPALPPGTILELVLASPIDLGNAAVGDVVQAVLARPVQDGRNVLVPAGAVARGRLVRLERYRTPIDHYVIGLTLNTLETGGAKIPFTATMQKAGPHSALVKESKGLNPTFNARNRRPSMQILVNEVQRGLGILHWRASEREIAKGLKMLWELER